MDPDLTPLVERIRAAAAQGTPLRIRGGGSKDFYGEALQGELLETAGLRGIVNYEPSELVVTVRAGTPLAELEQLLAQSGQCLPFEPLAVEILAAAAADAQRGAGGRGGADAIDAGGESVHAPIVSGRTSGQAASGREVPGTRR